MSLQTGLVPSAHGDGAAWWQRWWLQRGEHRGVWISQRFGSHRGLDLRGVWLSVVLEPARCAQRPSCQAGTYLVLSTSCFLAQDLRVGALLAPAGDVCLLPCENSQGSAAVLPFGTDQGALWVEEGSSQPRSCLLTAAFVLQPLLSPLTFLPGPRGQTLRTEKRLEGPLREIPNQLEDGGIPPTTTCPQSSQARHGVFPPFS